MSLTSGGNAPYAPPGTVTDVLTRYRERGMQTPFTTDVLERAGVPESLSARTLQSLKLLGFIDAEGNPTDLFDRANRGSQADYNELMKELLLDTYAEVIAFADPAEDTYDRVRDAFRGFNPRGQQERMVKLFLGLLDYIDVDVSKANASRNEGRAASSTSPRAGAVKKATKATTPQKAKVESKAAAVVIEDDSAGLPPGLVGLLRQVPRGGEGWPAARRDEFLAAFTAVLNFTIPVRDTEPPSGNASEEDSS